MRPRNRWRRGLTACALSAALVVGSTAMTTTSASGAPDAPVAADVSHDGPVYRYSAYIDGADLTVDLSATGGTGELTYEIVDQPSAGGAEIGTASVEGSVATLDINGSATPGPATFTYKATDADGVASNVATVSFDVVNQAPLGRNLEFSTEQGDPLDLWPYARDAEDGGPFLWLEEANRVTYGDPSHGVVKPFFTEENDLPEFAAVGHKAVYVPDAGFTGTDSFDYTVTDSEGKATTKTVTVHVTEPEPTKRGEVTNLRYRCAFHVKTNEDNQSDPNGEYDEGATKLVNSVMGGDVAFRIDVRAKAPRRLSPGEKFTVPDQQIDLKMPQGMAQLLAGVDLTDEAATLETVGFGQTAIGGQATAAAHFTETATGKEYDVDMSGLKSQMVPMTTPVPSDGVTIPVKGSLPELTAPKKGRLIVSMPQEFFIDSTLDPGVLGIIKYVGMRCYATPGSNLKIVSSKVVTKAKTTTRGSAPKVAYGKQAKVKVRVSKKATGKVRVFKGKRRLGVAKLRRGRATVKLGRKALRPGKHRLRVKYAGNKHFKASKDRTTIRVTKASPRVRAVKAGPKRVVAKKTRARVRIRVRAAGLSPRGRVVIRAGRRVIARTRIHHGRATVRVKRFKRAGRKHLRVRYRGTPTIKAGSDRLTIRVVKRR